MPFSLPALVLAAGLLLPSGLTQAVSAAWAGAERIDSTASDNDGTAALRGRGMCWDTGFSGLHRRTAGSVAGMRNSACPQDTPGIGQGTGSPA